MRHILRGQEKQNGVFSLLALCHALPLLLGIYQKVSLRLTARVFPQKFPPSISSAQDRKYFVDFSEYLRLRGVYSYFHANHFLCTNLRENEAYMLQWRTFQTPCGLSVLSHHQYLCHEFWRC